MNAHVHEELQDRGLTADGTLAREGSLSRVAPEFAPVVDAARSLAAERFGERLHSAYLYGSIPRGTAVAGVSDLDLLLALEEEPTDADRAAAREMETALDSAFPQIDGVGALTFGRERLLSELERFDLGFFLVCLCTPLLGPDLAAELPRYRPDSLLARETNGDLELLLPGLRKRYAAAADDADLRRLARGAGRHLTRTAFTLVMPRWGGWTSDLERSAEIFGGYYPERAAQARTAAALGRRPVPDRAALAVLLDDFAPWLVAEYTATHGVKAPRP